MTILNEYSIIRGGEFFLSFILIVLAICSISYPFSSIRRHAPAITIITTLIISVCLSIGASVLTIYTFKNPEHYIECTFDENYSAQELMDKYEIVSTRGKIVRLREKENGT